MNDQPLIYARLAILICLLCISADVLRADPDLLRPGGFNVLYHLLRQTRRHGHVAVSADTIQSRGIRRKATSDAPARSKRRACSSEGTTGEPNPCSKAFMLVFPTIRKSFLTTA